MYMEVPKCQSNELQKLKKYSPRDKHKLNCEHFNYVKEWYVATDHEEKKHVLFLKKEEMQGREKR